MESQAPDYEVDYEIEKMFRDEVRDKKRTATGAFHMRGKGVKHHMSGIKFPSDYLTARQKKKLNGDVVVSNVFDDINNVPTLEEIQRKDFIAAKKILKIVREKHGINTLAKHWGKSAYHVTNHVLKEYGLHDGYPSASKEYQREAKREQRLKAQQEPFDIKQFPLILERQAKLSEQGQKIIQKYINGEPVSKYDYNGYDNETEKAEINRIRQMIIRARSKFMFDVNDNGEVEEIKNNPGEEKEVTNKKGNSIADKLAAKNLEKASQEAAVTQTTMEVIEKQPSIQAIIEEELSQVKNALLMIQNNFNIQQQQVQKPIENDEEDLVRLEFKKKSMDGKEVQRRLMNLLDDLETGTNYKVRLIIEELPADQVEKYTKTTEEIIQDGEAAFREMNPHKDWSKFENVILKK